MPLEEIVVGREPDDLKKFGKAGCIFLGKHTVGTGFDSHLANPILMDVARPHVVLILGKRGSGKCLHGDSLVPLADGSAIPIKELCGKSELIFSMDENLKIIKKEKTEFFEREVETLLKIKLRSGREIKLTQEHPLLTLTGWRPAVELHIGSRIATPRKIENFGNQRRPEHEIKLLAYLIAEGHLGNNFVLFSNMEEKIINEFSESIKQFDPSLRIVEHSKAGCYRITKSEEEIKRTDSLRNSKNQFIGRKSSISEWLHNLGIYGKLSPEKFIPECIFKLPKEQLAIFLNRLFSCDGSIYKSRKGEKHLWGISYSSASKRMIRQIQHLLMRFGILSKLREKKIKTKNQIFDSFELEISTANILDFIKQIGFFGVKEGRQKICILESENIERNPNVDTIPSEIWDFYRPANWAEVGRKMGYSIPKGLRTSINYSPSRQKLLQISEIENNFALKLLACSDIFWDEIISMEKLEGKFKVYDIAVPETHNFVANDIIVHNSYTGAVMAEEVMNLPHEIKQNLSVLLIDTMGIFWSMKNPNEADMILLRDWNIQPKGFGTFNAVPSGLAEFYKKSGIPFDSTFAISPNELTAGDWAVTFGIELLSPLGILLERALKKISGLDYSIEQIIEAIESEKTSEPKDKLALQNRFLAAEDWGIFSEKASEIENFLKPGIASVLDISLMDWPVRNLLIGILARKIYSARTAARREEEAAKISGEEKQKIPLTWIIVDEAHNFLPSEGKTAATDSFLTLIRQGRQPGVSLVLITQRPNKLHEDAIAQSDLIISHRLTSKPDLDALGSVMQTYLLEDIRKSIADMPKTKGAAIILDDNSERLFGVQVRPRQSWHAGGSPIALQSKSKRF